MVSLFYSLWVVVASHKRFRLFALYFRQLWCKLPPRLHTLCHYSYALVFFLLGRKTQSRSIFWRCRLCQASWGPLSSNLVRRSFKCPCVGCNHFRYWFLFQLQLTLIVFIFQNIPNQYYSRGMWEANGGPQDVGL